MTQPHSFGRYRVTGTLGAGAMGEVYAAVDEVLGREVAVKTLRGHSNGLAARMLDERFRQEARAIAALAHPGVVQVFDIDLQAEPPYLVMERVAGPSLKERLAQGPLPIDQLRGLGIQIGRALAAAHAARIVHRDVKPANILVAGDGAWKLADFGVAHVPDSSLTMTGQFVGSPAYAPPEALVRGQADAEGDVYGLGATMYQAAAGTWPRLDDTSGALIPTVPPVAQLVPGLPAEIAAMIDRAVAVEPAHRPTAAELADVLAGASPSPAASLASAPVAMLMPPPRASSPVAIAGYGGASTGYGAEASQPGAHPVPLPAAPRRPVRWKPWAAAAAGVLLIGLIAASRNSSSRSPARSLAPNLPSSAPTPAEMAEDLEPSGDLRVDPPPMSDPQQVKAWNKMVDHLDRGNWDEARDRLYEFVDEYGESPQTAALARHLEAMGERAPRKKHKGRRH